MAPLIVVALAAPPHWFGGLLVGWLVVVDIGRVLWRAHEARIEPAS